jgi:hypothetical protein
MKEDLDLFLDVSGEIDSEGGREKKRTSSSIETERCREG